MWMGFISPWGRAEFGVQGLPWGLVKPPGVCHEGLNPGSRILREIKKQVD